jgi:carboxypeptidase T
LPRYHITISNPDSKVMADLVLKYHIDVLDHGIRHKKDTGYSVEAIAQPDEIQLLKDAGYQIQQHEDVEKIGKERQKEVGKGNRYLEAKQAKHASTSGAP